MNIRLGLRWEHGYEDSDEVKPEVFRLLHAIQEGGSLRVAAAACEISYRNAWGLLQKWERAFGAPLARLERGRGACLTALGQKLLWGETRAQARLGPDLESLASEISAELHRTLRGDAQDPLRIFASHGLAITLLRDLLLAERQIELDLQFRGSLECLRLLRASRCEIAGFHLAEGQLGARLVPRYRKLLDSTDILVHVVRRRQGLMTAPDNPLLGIADLTKNSVRFVNRQPGSGTRILLDLLLEEAGIATDQVRGYSTEEFTHLAVAAMVASGAATAGFGIEAAARRFNLRFIPVTWENYWFALRRENLTHPSIAVVMKAIRAARFRKKVAALTGYEAPQSGATHSVESVMAEGAPP